MPGAMNAGGHECREPRHIKKTKTKMSHLSMLYMADFIPRIP